MTVTATYKDVKSSWELTRQADAVIMVVADVFIVDEAKLVSSKWNSRDVSEARFAAYRLMKTMIPLSNYGIARAFKREPQGIRYGVAVCDEKRQQPYYDEMYRTCERLLKSIL